MLRYFLALLFCLACGALAAEPLTLLAEDDWFPYAFARDGQADGMAVEIVREAYRLVGVAVQFRTMPYARCMQLVEVGREIGCFDSLQDITTLPMFRFGQQPLFSATIAIYGHQPESGMTVAALADKRVGVTNGYTYGNEVEQNSSMRKDWAVSDLASLRKLALGRLDYALVYTRVADALLKRNPRELAGLVYRVGTVLDNPLYVSFSRRNLHSEAAMIQLDHGLKLLHQQGKYQPIIDRWLPH